MKSYLVIAILFLLFMLGSAVLPTFYHQTTLSSQEQDAAMEIYKRYGHGLNWPLVLNIKPTEKRIIDGQQTYLFTGYSWFGIPVKKNRVYIQNEGISSGHEWAIWNSSWWK